MKIAFYLFLTTLFVGCTVENINYTAPIMTTLEPEKVLTNSAILGGSALSEGGKNISEYGIVWSNQNPPTINHHKIIEGERLGSFRKNHQIFEANSTYYYSSYGKNEIGVGYGTVYEFTTSEEAPCNTTPNAISTRIENLQISYVSSNKNVYRGNLEIETNSPYSYTHIFVNFNEASGLLPESGVYKTVSNFELNRSIQEVYVQLFTRKPGQFGSSYILANLDQKVYVKNENDILTIIFCDFRIDNDITLNGEFTYTP